MKHMRMPRGSKLDRLIRFPKEFNDFLDRMEETDRLAELHEALQELPESTVRDARIAQVLVRQDQIEKAKALVYKHPRCFLCRSMYFNILLKHADEATVRQIAENYRPWMGVGNNVLNFEARYNDMMTVAVAASNLKRTNLANEMFMGALEVSRILRMDSVKRVVFYDMARARMWDNELLAARSTFEHVLTLTRPGLKLSEYVHEYMTWISWIQQDCPDGLPEWSKLTLEAAKKREALPAGVDYPPSAGVPFILKVMQDLRTLTHEFHIRLSEMYIQKNRDFRDQLVAKICRTVGPDVGEMIGFVSRSMVALAMSMQHDPEAVKVLKSAFRWPTTGIAAMSMLYYANLIQIHANLPHVEMDQEEVRQAIQLLASQFHHMPAGQQKWLMQWMQDFTPVTLYLLSDKCWNAYPPLHDFVVVSRKGVVRGSEPIEKFPRFFMVRHIKNLLAGKTPPENNRMQAWRTVQALLPLGQPLVIYQPVVKMFEDLIN